MAIILSEMGSNIGRAFGSVSVPSLRELDQAYRSYRAFRRMTPEQMRDLGISESDLETTGFAAFLEQARK